MRLLRRPLLLVLLVAAVEPAAGASDAPALTPGPLRVRDNFLLGAGFLALESSSADVLEAGSWRLEAVWSLSNTWAISPDIDLALRARAVREPITRELLDELALLSPDGGSIFVDGEVSRLLISAQRGLGRRIQLEIAVPILDVGGGFLDRPIENFHDAFSLAVDGRNGAPRDDFLVSLITRLGRFEQLRPPSAGLGDVVIGARFRVTGDDSPALRASVQALAKLPTGGDEPLVSSGSTDFGLQLLLGHYRRRWSFHASGGIVFLGPSDELRIGSQEVVSAAATVERAIGPRTSLLVQVDASQSPFGDLATSRIGLTAIQGTLGVKRALARHYQLFAGATDNFENFTNSSDLNLHLGISRRF